MKGCLLDRDGLAGLAVQFMVRVGWLSSGTRFPFLLFCFFRAIKSGSGSTLSYPSSLLSIHQQVTPSRESTFPYSLCNNNTKCLLCERFPFLWDRKTDKKTNIYSLSLIWCMKDNFQDGERRRERRKKCTPASIHPWILWSLNSHLFLSEARCFLTEKRKRGGSEGQGFERGRTFLGTRMKRNGNNCPNGSVLFTLTLERTGESDTQSKMRKREEV